MEVDDMKLRSGYKLIQGSEGWSRLVCDDGTNGKSYDLNGRAAFIVAKMMQPTTVEGIAIALVEKYHLSYLDILGDVYDFVYELRKMGMVEEAEVVVSHSVFD